MNVTLNIRREGRRLLFGNRSRDAKIPLKKPFLLDGAHRKYDCETHTWIPRELAAIGQRVLREPHDYHIELVPQLPGEAPFYCLVRVNKKREVAHYCFGRGLLFDILYIGWQAAL